MCVCVSFRQIDIVITCCSVYNPTPSMAACLVNKFGMRHDVLTYHLSGMGCSSSLVSIDMAKNLLKVSSSPALSVGLQSVSALRDTKPANAFLSVQKQQTGYST